MWKTDGHKHTLAQAQTHTHHPGKPLNQKRGKQKDKEKRGKEGVRELGADNDDATESVMAEVERGNGE